jgi:hypothetical protein
MRFAESTITSVQELAGDAFSTAIDLLNMIAGLANTGMDIDTDISLNRPVRPGIITYLGELPQRPDLGDMPDMPPIVYDFTESLYTSNLGDKLTEVLLAELTNGSTGLTAVVESDIWNRESERDQQANADAKLKIAAMWAEGNSPLPDACLYALQAWADIRYQDTRLDKSRDVRIESFKRADDNAKFVKDLSMKYESVIREYMGKYWDRQLKKASDIMNYGVLVYDALIKWKLALVELYKGDAQIYEATAHGVAAINGSQTGLYDADTRLEIGVAGAIAEGIKAKVEILKGKIQNVMAASNGIASVASHLAAGAMSAIHAGAQVHYEGRDSNSAQSEVSTSCSDRYNHEVEE